MDVGDWKEVWKKVKRVYIAYMAMAKCPLLYFLVIYTSSWGGDARCAVPSKGIGLKKHILNIKVKVVCTTKSIAM